MNETSKSIIRRLHDSRFCSRYFVGNGIDIGAGQDSLGKYQKLFPLITGLKSWDVHDGDATHMQGLVNDSFDFVHSSHCLEHLSNPFEGFSNWIRICKPGGHIVVTIPDEDLYEQGVFPSTFNMDHKVTWTILKHQSWSQKSISLIDFLSLYREKINVLKLELIDFSYLYNIERTDQTYHSIAESAIEFIVRKK